MFKKNIFSLLGLLFIGNRITTVYSEEVCDVKIGGGHCLQNTYYLINPDTSKQITNTIEEGRLYYCTGEGETITCAEQNQVGYYVIDAKTVYTCQDKGSGVRCKKGEVPIGTECTASNISQLFVNNEVISFCLDTTTNGKIDLTGANNGNYLVTKNSNPAIDVFGITGINENYAIVSIQDKIITLNVTYTNNLKYVYANKEKVKIMEHGDKSTVPLTASNELDEDKILELLCKDGRCKSADSVVTIDDSTTGIQMIRTDGETLNDGDYDDSDNKSLIRMYKCQSGECDIISGYHKAGEDYFIITTEGSVKAQQTAPASGCTKDNIGLVYKSGGGGVYRICLDENISLPLLEENVGNYVLGSGTSVSPFLSISNKMIIISDSAQDIYLDDKFKAENNRHYVVKTGTSYYAYKYIESSNNFEKIEGLLGVKNYKIHDDNSNVFDEYSLADTSSISQTDVNKWVLFNCKEGHCQQTYGYMKSGNEKKYFKYYADGTSNAILSDPTNPAEFTTCATGGTNGLMRDGELCIKYANDETKIIADTSTKKVLVLKTANGDPFYETASKNIVVEVGTNYIIYDNIYLYDNAILTYHSEKIDTTSISNSNKSDLILYDCAGDGVCSVIGGYAIKGNEFYYLNKKAASSPYSAAYTIVEGESCANSIGEIVTIGDKKYLCLDGTEKVLLENGYYPLGNTDFSGANNVFDSDTDKRKMIRITDSLIALEHSFEVTGPTNLIIDRGDEFVQYVAESKKFAISEGVDGIFVYKNLKDRNGLYSNIYEEVSLADTTAVTAQDIGSWNIFDCTDGKCKRTYGYIKSGDALPADTKYFSFASTGENNIVDFTGVQCATADDIGNLLTNGELCTQGANTPVKKAMTSSALLISNEQSNIFASSESSTSIVIKATTSSFTLDYTDRFNLYKVDSNAITTPDHADFDDASKRAKIGLFECADNGICKNVSGYAYDAEGALYYDIGNTLGATETTDTANAECTNYIGKFIKISNRKYLCVSSTEKVELPILGSDVQSYILGEVASGSKLESNKMIRMTSTTIVVDKSYEGDDYLVKSDKYTAYKYSDETYSTDSSLSGLYTYKKMESLNLYKKIDIPNVALADLNDLLLFQCETGKCSVVSGTILVGDTNVKACTESNCNQSAAVTANCNALLEVGKVKVNEGTLQLCLGKTGASPAFALADVSASKVYYTSIDNANFQKVVANSDATIIAQIKPEIGYYYVTDNVFSDSGNVILKCSEESCTAETTNSSCDESNIGKFTSEKKLCLYNGKVTDVMSTTAKSYLMSYGDNSPFYQTIKPGKTGVITVGNGSITLDTSKTKVCVDANKVVTDKSGSSCSGGATEFTCSDNGLCIEGENAPVVSIKKLGPCTGVTINTCDAGSAATFCLNTDGKIYGVQANGSTCASKIESGVHVYNVATKKEITLGTDFVDTAEASNLVIYACSAGGCEQTIGYAKMKTRGTVTTEEPGSWNANYASYCKLSGGKCTQLAATETWAASTFYAFSDGVMEITNEGGKSASAGVACASGKIGLLDNNNKLCLGESSTILADYSAVSFHVLTGNLSPASIFKSLVSTTDGSTGIVITSDTNIIYYNAAVSDTSVNVINITTMKTQALGGDISGEVNNLRMYECNNGSCTRTRGYVESNSAYYEVKIDAVSASETGAADCNTIGKLKNDGNFCVDNTGVAIASTTANYIYYEGTEYKFARMLPNIVSITTLTGTIADGANAINVNTAKVVTIGTYNNLISEVGSITNLALYYCQTSKNSCIQTYGYVKTTGSIPEYLEIPKTGTNAKVASLVETCATAGTDFGKLYTGNKLCIGNAITIGFNEPGLYQFKGDACNGNPFTKSANPDIIIDVTSTSMVENPYKLNILSDGIHLLELSASKKYNDIDFANDGTVSVATALELYNCADGACTQTYGYVKVGTSYYTMEKGKTSNTATIKTACSSNVGEILTGNKLCIDGIDANAIDFESGNDSKYYVITVGETNNFIASGGSVLIKSIKNAFVFNNYDGTDSQYYIINTNGQYNYYTCGGSKTTYTNSNDASGAKIGQKIENGFYHVIANTAVEAGTGYSLFSCSNSVCEPTIGYVKNSSNTKYFTISSNESTEITSKLSSVTCSGDAKQSGGLGASDYLCLSGAGSGLKTVTADKDYLIKIDEGHNGIFENYKGKSIIVNYIANVITYNNRYSGGPLLINTGTMTTQALGSSVSDDDKGKLELYNCGVSGICERAAGYIYDGTNYFSISKTNAANNKKSADDDVEFVTSCTAANAGKVNKSESHKVCLGDSDVAFPSGGSTQYIASTGSNYYHIRAITKIITVEDITEDVEDGLIVFNRNTVKKFTLPNAAATINRELSELALFSCDINNAKKCIQTYGYIKSNDSSHEKYYAFDSTSNIAVTSDYILGSSDCAATTTDYGKLKANKLCIGNGIEIDFSDTGKYKYKYDSVAFATNPFTRSASPDVIIDVGANHMIVDGLYLNSFSDGVHLIEINANMKLTEKNFANDESITNATGLSLYNCKEGTCTQTAGYIKSSSSYYAVSKTTSAIIPTGQACSSHVGEINSTSKKLCVDGDDAKAIDFATSGTNYYHLTVSSTSAFGNGVEVIVKEIKNAFILENVNLSENGKYIVKIGEKFNLYTYTKETNVVAPDTGSTIAAYEEVEEGNIYVQTTTLSTSVLLFSCNGGSCVKSGGYIKVNDAVKKCTTTSCNSNAESSELASAEDCSTGSGDDVGKVIIVGSDLKLCRVSGTATNDAGIYLVGSSIYHIGTNVIGKVAASNGYYIVKANVITTTIEVSDSDNLVSCKGTCTSTAVASAAIGYYKNVFDSKFVIKCGGAKCVLEAVPEEACSSNIGLLKSSGLCLATGESTNKIAGFVATGGADVYYMVDYENSNSLFKSVVKTGETSKGLIKATTNSITLEKPQDSTDYCMITNTQVASTPYDETNCTNAGGSKMICGTSGECNPPPQQ